MSTPRTRITVSLPRELVQRIERQATRRRASRSRVVEDWLRAGARSQASAALDEEIERYYSEASADDRAEDDALARAAGRKATQVRVDEE